MSLIDSESFVIGALSVFSIVTAACLAYLAEKCPGYVVALETSSGFMLIGGLALLGVAMPILP